MVSNIILLALIGVASAMPFRIQLFEGDIVLTNDLMKKLNGGASAYDAAINNKWPNGIVPYVFNSKFGTGARRLAREAISELERDTCLKFTPRVRQRDYIEFIGSRGCSSRIGKGRGRQYLNIDNGCMNKGSVMHELMHAIGFHHEQSRLDRDNYIKIYWKRIEKGMEFNFDKYSHGEADYLGEPYDYDSIMHYRPAAFGNGKVTLEAIGDPKRSLGQRDHLTDIDKRQVNKLYNCKVTQPSKAPSTKPPTTKGNCKDLDSQCPALAKDGHCTAFWVRAFMKAKCRRSCYFC